MTDADRLNINTLRFLAVEAVEQAGSGHPGLPLGAAPLPMCCGTGTYGTTRTTRPGPTATGSSSQRGTGAPCCTACCTSRATTCLLRTFGAFASGAAEPPGTRSTADRVGHPRRPGRGRTAVADHGQKPHRVRQPQTGHRGGAWGAVWEPRPCVPRKSLTAALATAWLPLDTVRTGSSVAVTPRHRRR